MILTEEQRQKLLSDPEGIFTTEEGYAIVEKAVTYHRDAAVRALKIIQHKEVRNLIDEALRQDITVKAFNLAGVTACMRLMFGLCTNRKLLRKPTPQTMTALREGFVSMYLEACEQEETLRDIVKRMVRLYVPKWEDALKPKETMQ